MIVEKNQKIDYRKLAILWIATFVIVYLATIAVMSLVYGYDFENSTSYNETMNATKQAANYTESLMIDRYIQNIENQTLGEIQ